MRIVFAGTPAVAVPSLEALVGRHDVVAVVSRPDSPVGRRQVLTPSPVSVAAASLGIPIIHASRFDHPIEDQVAKVEPDLGVVVAYGGLIPQRALDIPRLGWINLHFSELPKLRGAAPLQRDIMAGATRAHLTIFQLVEELDAGPILDVRDEPLYTHETAGTALARLAESGAQALVDVVNRLENGSLVAVAQEGVPTYAHKLTSLEGQLHATSTVTEAYNRFRGVTPEPGAWLDTTHGRLKILECGPERAHPSRRGRLTVDGARVLVGFSDGSLELQRVQSAGKSALSAGDWVRGIKDVDAWSFS